MSPTFRRACVTMAVGVTGLVAQPIAHAHISIASGVGIANTTQEVTFGVGHGCAGDDTYKVRIEIPAGVTSVRPLRSDFGRVSVEKDATGIITAVVWQKSDVDALESDIAYYKLVVRMKLPDQPFKSLYFPAHQTCRSASGTLSIVDWIGLPTDAPVDGAAAEPAAPLPLIPARRSGWNKFVVAQPVSDLSVFFSDALIVWKGTAAYSANPATVDLIKSTTGVTALTSLTPSDEIWVRY